ncbi:TonB-dependent receptor [Sphingomonas sp.]|uniref:TonB-dependent receptor n=1 Tax=Sphingomonas sp. TaxID=28214 RepID=UPI0025CC5928|nr:TonB-dependent receptor [Sphingomonas sp.]
MTDRTAFGRALTLGLLASTAFTQPAFAQDTGAAPAPATQPAPAATSDDNDNVIVVTATKREENLQDVPISVQAIGTKRLDQLNISNFQDYTKQLPSVSFQTAQPGVTVVYMRGVATGGDGNHSGSLPSVGSYLDEQPITTIGGTLDVHIYDIARIESLAGPQGTLYGASSEAGTIRIITNKPELGVTSGRIDGEINTLTGGDRGGKLEGMINLPLADRVAFRAAAFYQKDAGFIDNIHGERTYYAVEDVDGDDVPNLTVTNTGLEKKNFNDLTTWGGRAALKVDLDDNWTATPTLMFQKMRANGVFFYDPDLGEDKIDRFRDDFRSDKFWQAALTIQGKIANFDVTYAGAYMDRRTYTLSDYADYADAYEQLYADYYGGLYGRGLQYFYYLDNAGNRSINPQQFIIGTDHFRKLSQELRIASPADKPFRVIAGAFYQRQSNLIHQDYKVDGLGDFVSVNGLPGTLWLTQQKRVDKDYALFGEASYDVTPQITLTAGGRWYKFDNSLIGFFGFGRNPGDGGAGPYSAFPRNAAGSNRTGVAQCWTVSGERLYDRDTNTYATDRTLLPPVVSGSPCTNLADFVDGKLVPKRVKDSGVIYRFNATWKPSDDLLFYATWSRGFRPGGINRRGDIAPYDADFLNNYELGWKTTLGPVRWNGAVYHQLWKKFQFSFLGQNSFTEIHNGKDARINGIETDLSYSKNGLSLTAAAAYTDAKSKGDICGSSEDPTPHCDFSFISVPSGSRLPVTPKFKGSATARYTWHVFNDAKAHVQGGVAYQGSARSSLRSLTAMSGVGLDCSSLGFPTCDPNLWQGRIKSSTVVDLFAGIDWTKWSAELYVTNVFDSTNELSRGVNCGSCTRSFIVPGRPRTLGLRVGYKY